MDLGRAIESLEAAELCHDAGYVNSSASRAYYSIFQAAQVAMEAASLGRQEWSHTALRGQFSSELTRRRKLYPSAFGEYLAYELRNRQIADYGGGISGKIATRLIHRAQRFVAAVRHEVEDG